jgi:hypothetical protein
VKLRYVPRTRSRNEKRRTGERIALGVFIAALVLPGIPVALRDAFPRAWCTARLPACSSRSAD